MRVLIVDDDSTLAALVQRALEREGDVACVAGDGATALALAASWKPDAILLDLTLPDGDGLDVAREIRARSAVPILMVTARAGEDDRVLGLDTGADDYIVKPFSVRELLARLRAAVRVHSGEPPQGGVVQARDLTLDPQTRRVTRESEVLDLTPKEFEILRLLMIGGGAPVRRGDLTRAVWGVDAIEGANTLDVHISWLRRKLDRDPLATPYIQTLRGIGFRLHCEE
ncbi:MAG: response regulator transcription factor [Actinomycetota bacterium]